MNDFFWPNAPRIRTRHQKVTWKTCLNDSKVDFEKSIQKIARGKRRIFQKFQTPVTVEPEHVETQTQLESMRKISALLSM